MTSGLRPAREHHRVTFGTHEMIYTVEHTRRHKTLAISVDVDGARVLAPVDAGDEEVSAAVRAKSQWLLSKLSLFDGPHPGRGPREFVTGEAYHYLGRAYRLRVVPGPDVAATRVRTTGRALVAPVTSGLDGRLARLAARRGLIVWYEGQAKRILPERIARFAERAGVQEPSLPIRDQELRWGSCDS